VTELYKTKLRSSRRTRQSSIPPEPKNNSCSPRAEKRERKIAEGREVRKKPSKRKKNIATDAPHGERQAAPLNSW